ncbi:RNA 2',3'-cyclic phosphodiesterase [Candidatus Pacearchaeota archaeon]|nr:RNA 2',3'-cyclic phosphodiesterase [Candidatus Pacearchaeota archaeon]
MRTFISIDLPYEMNKEIFRLQDKLSSLKEFAGINTVRVQNIHVTLKFLGEMSNAQAHIIRDLLKEIEFEKFQLLLEDLDYFPSKEAPRVIWIGMNTQFKLEKLRNLIEEKLNKAGIVSDKDKEFDTFTPHVTLAKIKFIRNKEKLKEQLDNIEIKKLKFNVESFQLKKSKITPKGSIYETIEEFELK